MYGGNSIQCLWLRVLESCMFHVQENAESASFCACCSASIDSALLCRVGLISVKSGLGVLEVVKGVQVARNPDQLAFTFDLTPASSADVTSSLRCTR